MKKSVIAVVGVAILAIILIAAISPNKNNAQVVRVGAILALTGNSSAHGEFAKRGIEIALAELKDKGVRNLEVTYEDGQVDPKLATNAWNKLVSGNGVKTVLTYSSPVSMAVAPLANRDRVPVMGIVSAPAYESADDFTFRIIGSSVFEARAMASMIENDLKFKKVAIIFMNNDYGKGVASAFKKEFAGKGEIVAEESFLPTDSDFRTPLTKIKAARPEMILIGVSGKDAGTVVRQAKTLGIDARFICAASCDNPDTITAAGGSGEGLFTVSPTNKTLSSFERAYKAKYSDEPSFATLRMYDAMMIAGTSIESCADKDYSTECIKDAIYATEDFPGASYPVNFDRNGDINDQFVTKEVRGGKFVVIK